MTTNRLKVQKVSKHFCVPHNAVLKFFGRQTLIEQLQSSLLKPLGRNDKPITVVLQGLGGQGKTQIALELCRRLKKHCRGVFWLDATSRLTLERGFENLARELVGSATSDLKDVDTIVRFVLNTIQEWEERWLMVYDNYDYPDVFKDIKRFLPDSKSIHAIDDYTLIASGGQGGIIFTSRHNATERLGQYVPIPSMVDDGGVDLLLRHMSGEEKERNWTVGVDIVRRLGGLALAIEHAAAYISFNQIGLRDFIDEYERKKANILQYTPMVWEYQKPIDGLEQSSMLSAFTTWEMSFEQVERGDKARKDHITQFLSVTAFLEPSHIGSYLFETYIAEEAETFPWLDIFMRQDSPSDESEGESESDTDQPSLLRRSRETNWSTDQFWWTIKRLNQLSLVQSIERKSLVQSDEQKPEVWFSIHPVISDWLQVRERKRLIQKKRLKEAIALMSVVVGSSFGEVANALKRQELLAHLDTCMTYSRRRAGLLGSVRMRRETNNFGEFYKQQGKYDRSEELYEALLKEDMDNLDERDMNLWQSKANLASTYLSQGRWDAAEELQVQVIEMRKKKLRADHPRTMININNLAMIYMEQSRWDAAEELLVQVMEMHKKNLGADHPDTLASMHNLASTYSSQGRWDAAEELQVQVMEMCKKNLGADHPHTLTSVANLASTYSDQGRWDAAEELQEEVMEMHKKKLGADHPHTLTSINNLAMIYIKQSRWDAAEELVVQVMEMQKKNLGADHPDTLASMHNLASTYSSQGKWDAAEELQVQVMEMCKKNLGADHSHTLTSMANLASTYSDQGRWDAAEELQVEVMKMYKEKLGADHPGTLISMNNLASTYSKQGRWDAAEELQVQVMEMFKKKFGIDHPDMLTCMSNLAATYMNQGRWDAAEELQEEVMEMRKKKLGADHPQTLTSMINLGLTYSNQGRWDAAVELQVQVIEIRKKKLGANHPDTLASMEHLTVIREVREGHEELHSMGYPVGNSEPVRHSKGEDTGRCEESAATQETRGTKRKANDLPLGQRTTHGKK
jgi:tetratricopeptide (TPR) repeat protein